MTHREHRSSEEVYEFYLVYNNDAEEIEYRLTLDTCRRKYIEQEKKNDNNVKDYGWRKTW